jgi:hypothetical protein
VSPAEAAELAAIDWDRPWLEPYRGRGRCLARHLAVGATVAEALNTELAAAPLAPGAGPLCFVPQCDLPTGTAYEAHIAATGRVPTRDNRHDFFNGLVWLTSPQLKRQLNRLQAAHLSTAGIGPTRGAARDTLTLFDENAAWLQGPPALTEALRRRDWPALFVHQRAAWAGARLRLFGHALLDKLCRPRKAITAHVWLVPGAPDGGFGEAEAWLAGHLTDRSDDGGAGRVHHPLPVLGVPGWWAANDDPAFYDDRAVFRPAPGCGVPARS